MSGKDTIGMKDVLTSFLNLCIQLIKLDQDYCSLADDIEWLEQNL